MCRSEVREICSISEASSKSADARFSSALKDSWMSDPGLLRTYPRTAFAELGVDSVECVVSGSAMDSFHYAAMLHLRLFLCRILLLVLFLHLSVLPSHSATYVGRDRLVLHFLWDCRAAQEILRDSHESMKCRCSWHLEGFPKASIDPAPKRKRTRAATLTTIAVKVEDSRSAELAGRLDDSENLDFPKFLMFPMIC